jgi:hypothetical protein
MAEIKLSGKLPGGDANGLGAIAPQLVTNPHRVHVLVALVDCRSTTTDNDSGDTMPTARIRRVEAITGAEDLKTLERLLRRAMEHRTGQTVLPMDLEDELTAAFEDIDPNTGEVKE